MEVGIRELKARLSEYVDRAAKGQGIRVTDRASVEVRRLARALAGRTATERPINSSGTGNHDFVELDEVVCETAADGPS